MSCIVTKGDQPLTLFWTFTDAETNFERNLSTNDGVVISKPNAKLSVLSLEAVKSRHRGVYGCKASNRAGVAQYSALLAINGLI